MSWSFSALVGIEIKWASGLAIAEGIAACNHGAKHSPFMPPALVAPSYEAIEAMGCEFSELLKSESEVVLGDVCEVIEVEGFAAFFVVSLSV